MDAVASANEHLHPSKIFKIKNPQLKIQNPIRGVGGVDVTGGAEDFAYVLGEVKAVGVRRVLIIVYSNILKYI